MRGAPTLSTLVRFGARLRRAGLEVSIGQLESCARAFQWLDPMSRSHVYFAARATLLTRREDAALFGRYPTNPISMVVYLGCVAVYAWASFATLIVARKSDSLSDEMTPKAYADSRRRLLRFCLIVTVLCVFYGIRVVARWLA